MDTEALLQAYIQAWDDHDTDAIVDAFAPTYRAEFGESGIRGVAESWFEGFPDLSHDIDYLLADDETAMAKMTLRGTHDGEFHGIPPTGNEIEIPDHALARFDEAGQIVDLEATADFRRLYEQLGVTMPPASTREAENKAVVRRYFDAVNDRDRDAFLDTLHEAFQYGDLEGPEAMAESEWEWIEAMDFRIDLKALYADGDWVFSQWRGSGTHRGAIMGLEPTGEDWAVDALSLAHLDDGLIVEWWGQWEFASLLDQIGVIDAPVYSD